MKNFLLDSWQKTGKDIDAFKEIIECVASRTQFKVINSAEITVMSYAGKTEDGDKLIFHMCDPNNVPSLRDGAWTIGRKSINLHLLKAKEGLERLAGEMVEDSGVLFYNGIKCLFVSSRVLTQRLQPFGLGGEFLSERGLERDLVIARQFGKARSTTLVTREDNGITKVFSLLGGRYHAVPQDVLLNIYDAITAGGLMGRTECAYWEMNHFMTSIRIEFPEKADEFQALYGLTEKLVPGVILDTSDTGDCSIRVRGVWRLRNSVSIQEEVKQRHLGKFEIKDIIDDIVNSVFAEYTKLPEALCDLMECNITDPSWDLSKASQRTLNKKQIERVLRHAFRQLKITEAVGKKTEKSLFDQLSFEFDDSIAYTAYDLALAIMSMPERASGLHALTAEKLAKATGKAPYIKYTVAPSPAVVLTA